MQALLPRAVPLGCPPARSLPLVALLLSSLVALGCAASPAGPRGGAEPPHIIVVMVDDLGARDTSSALWDPAAPAALGASSHFRTPHLERLASRGVVFDEAYASAPVCTPTRTSFLTGQSPARTGITYWTKEKDRDTSAPHPTLSPPPWTLNGLQPGDVTLPGLLREVGYRTIHVGKAHFGTGDGGDPTNLGFDVNVAGWAAGGPGSFYGVDHFSADGRSRRRGGKGGNHSWDVPGLEAHHGEDVFLTDVLAERAEAELRRAVASGDRAFLHFAPYAVHAPLMPNPRVARRFAESGLDPAELAYATMVASVDDALGRLLDVVEDLGIAEETLILYTSDNGGLSAHSRGAPAKHEHNLPFRSGKGSAYEGGVRVPLVISGPGVPRDSRHLPGAVVTHDLFPTLLACAGAPTPDAPLDGQSLWPMLLGGAPAPERTILWHQPHFWGVAGPGIEPFTAIRRGPHKLIHFHGGGEPAGGEPRGRLELYDLTRDPGEQQDLVSSMRERTAELAELLFAELQARGGQLSLSVKTREPVPATYELIDG